MPEHYAKNIKQAKRNARIKRRRKRGWSRSELAQHYGLTTSRIDQIVYNPNAEKVRNGN
jgi:Mor family transcriptional regulator